MSLQKSYEKKKKKLIFSYLCFDFFWKTVLLPDLCGYLRSSFNLFPFSDSNEDSDTTASSFFLSLSQIFFAFNTSSLYCFFLLTLQLFSFPFFFAFSPLTIS
jgi:hypothetical protein